MVLWVKCLLWKAKNVRMNCQGSGKAGCGSVEAHVCDSIVLMVRSHMGIGDSPEPCETATSACTGTHSSSNNKDGLSKVRGWRLTPTALLWLPEAFCGTSVSTFTGNLYKSCIHVYYTCIFTKMGWGTFVSHGETNVYNKCLSVRHLPFVSFRWI